MEPDDPAASAAGQPRRPDDGAWVLAARAGDPDAFGRLFDRWFDPVYDVAWRIVRNPDTAAEVAQDVFLAAWNGLDRLEQPASFGGWVRRIARNRALNRLERERRTLPDDEQAAATLDRSAPEVDMTADLAEAEQRELVWAAASALGERDASLLDLHLRHGLGAGDIADELGVTPNNAHQLLHRLKGKLAAAVRAWVLWRDGGRGCRTLDGALTAAGLSTFGADAVRVIGRHAQGCDACTERQQLRLAPEALFAAMPIAVAPPVLRAQAVAALGDAGVPMAGAAATGPAPASGGDGAGGGDDAPGDGAGGGASRGDGAPGGGAPGGGDGAPGDGASLEGPAAAPGDGPLAPALGGHAAPAGGTGRSAGRARSVRWVAATGGIALLVVVLSGLAALSVGGSAGGGGDRGEVAGPPPPPPRGGAKATPPDVDLTGGTKQTPDTAVDAPPAPATTAPPRPPASEPPRDTVPPSTPPTTPPDAPPPTIGGFRVTAGGSCSQDPSERLVSLVWNSTGADSATITGPEGTTTHGPSGSATACVPTPAVFTLTVTGPGGTAEASRSVG